MQAAPRAHRPNQADASQSLRGFFLNCSRRIIHYYLREQREQSILRTAARRAAANSEVRCLVPHVRLHASRAWCLYVYMLDEHTPCLVMPLAVNLLGARRNQ
jgi:hypothetical protein